MPISPRLVREDASMVEGDNEHALIEELTRQRDAWLEAAKRDSRPDVKTWLEDIVDREDRKTVLRDSMSVDDASEIRRLRSDENYSWRAIAGYCHNECSAMWSVGWESPELQEVGMLICEAAAEKLGERPHADPWN
ncbi:MAG: hypothetical protein QOH79_3842 [Acidimicrobiaceae bacterium]